ncbi:MAG: putative bifunctional diguanylate cyclase/phosphodiesterase [Methyloligellaceae bacterium]
MFAGLPLAYIKGLREINDEYSHAVGDKLIKEFGRRLRALISENDIASRLGGDEFAILRIGNYARKDIDAFAAMLAKELNTVYDIGGLQIVSGTHIGIVLLGVNELDAEEIINCGETAKFHAKENSHLAYCYFERGMAANFQKRKAMEASLRRAVPQKQEFQIYFQPQFALDSGELRGFESLLRWHHPDKGIISPADFIPIAENTGLICELGDWVLNRACTDAVSWPRPCTVAVNVSPVQFRQDRFLADVRKALDKSGLAPKRLEIEVTESVLFQNTAQAIALLRDLKQLGVRIAMDDFGSGFSSLTHLWQFPFDNIKIDHSFISNVTTNAKVDKIVSAIIELGSALEISITAEGVETAEQEALLRNLNCEFVQGFRYGKPCPPDKIIFQDSVDIGIENLSKLAKQVQDSFANGDQSASSFGRRDTAIGK